MQMIQFYFIEQWPAIPVFSKWFFADNVSASGHLQEQIKYASKVVGYAAAIFGCSPQILNPHHILESWILSSWMVLGGSTCLLKVTCSCLVLVWLIEARIMMFQSTSVSDVQVNAIWKGVTSVYSLICWVTIYLVNLSGEPDLDMAICAVAGF